MRLFTALVAISLLVSAACHPGPVLTTEPKPEVGGTIAGIVTNESNAPVTGRRVTATNTESGAKFDATTGTNGGYTIKVPQGTYRLEVQLLDTEAVSKQPPETRINRSDLDPRRDFVIGVKR